VTDTWLGIVLGLVEGLTEFLPISSTGHLILVGDALEFKGARAAAFDVFIQLGAILAVVFLYFHRFLDLIPSFGKPSNYGGFSGAPGIAKLALGCLPAFVAGPLLHTIIKQHLFSSKPVAVALIVGGIAILLLDRGKTSDDGCSLENVTFKRSFQIGLFQLLALWPGISRSGSTIVGGLILGLSRKTALEFSFLLSVPVMLAAVAYDLLKNYSALTFDDISLFAIGFVTAFFSAIIAIRTFLGIVARFSLRPFGYYRIVLGIIVLLFAS
jgi:undecaprenyl-diphosphatase